MSSTEIHNILVPTDFSEAAYKAHDCAVALALKSKAKIIFIHVLEIPSGTSFGELSGSALITEKTIARSKDAIKKLASETKETHDIKTDGVSYTGDIYDNIIRAAHIYSADLIVMGAHGKSGLRSWLFGSNSYHVVNNSTIPVLTVHQATDVTHLNKIVFPFNNDLLTLKKIDEVICLATLLEAGILLLGFSETTDQKSIKSIDDKGNELIKLFNKNKINCSFHLVNGSDYADEILRFAKEQEADLISIATNQVHDVNKVFKTPDNNKILKHTSIPVLSVPVE
jgi:nucleotide-binding universal stress UspA family protein